MQRLVDLAREHEFILVHDFAYADVAFDGHVPPSVLQADGALDCAVELYSLTKSFSMAGWRMGFTLGRPDVVAALAKLKCYLDYGTFQPIQIASIVALREAADYPAEVCEIYRSRRDALCSGLDRAGWHIEPPKGTMFVWAPIPERARRARLARVRAQARARGRRGGQPRHRLRPGGDGHVRFALVENEQRINQATRSIRRLLQGYGSRGRRLLPTPSRRERAYLAKTPLLVARRGRRPVGQPARELVVGDRPGRAVRLSTSSMIVSPSRTAAIGPPRAASGAMWPTIRPCVAPEKRPSVISAISSPMPSPTSAPVTCSISRMPGPPAGPS